MDSNLFVLSKNNFMTFNIDCCRFYFISRRVGIWLFFTEFSVDGVLDFRGMSSIGTSVLALQPLAEAYVVRGFWHCMIITESKIDVQPYVIELLYRSFNTNKYNLM